jgi:hypothetical protein
MKIAGIELQNKLRPNQALPEGIPLGQADSRRPENVIARSAIQIREMQNSWRA